ncbi:MAG: 2-oxoglutarate dehydrogenase E1 component [Myxococcales bacterium]|nr:2-oxoglutarate dehydrogenase E1 component [Myxococcales bacterium]
MAQDVRPEEDSPAAGAEPEDSDEPAPQSGVGAPRNGSASNGGAAGGNALAGFGVNAGIVEEIRERYEVDPDSVDASWADLFGREPSDERESGYVIPFSDGNAEQPVRAPSPAEAEPTSQTETQTPDVYGSQLSDPQIADKQARCLRLIHAYRARGHRIADIDPLGGQSNYFPELDPAHYGFGAYELETPMLAGDLPGGPIQPLRQILDRLKATYCRSVGVEFLHIQDPGRRQWLQRRMEESQNETELSAEDRLRVLEKLSAAALFERFLHTKFLGQKRFSLEGAESLIPLLDTLVEEAPSHGVRELVVGMAHRGRLNVLSNILGKSLESIFSEFEDIELEESPFGSGDVKYHKGYSNDRRTRSGARIHLSLTANPSHLEAVDPVVEGRARAKQVRAGDPRGLTIIPVLLHGDAAFAGQGMVSETLNLSHLVGYSTGGTVHVIVNNQIGFTTTPKEARSTLYCTDAAKMIQAPILHVNGDDPEAAVHCVKLAMAYRQRFGDDVVIDMVCYRRHGHNEGDDPSFTQPVLYDKIRSMVPVRQKYTQDLVRSGLLSEEDVTRIETDLGEQLQQALAVIKTRPPAPDEPYDPRGPWTGYSRVAPDNEIATGVSLDVLSQVADRMGSTPQGFEVHPKLVRLLERRRKSISEDAEIDWATAESLAFGTLLLEGYPVRLSGQDSSRGTFSQRHAVFVDRKTGEEYAPLDHLSDEQARFEVYDSHLSEAGVLGFEYGYSLADPTTLTMWEAQFGDFVNGAQVIIDQFISSAHVKWKRMSGLVMLLPHGYEGQGPEHSSARIERFLQMCAEDNLQVVNCTTPAQYFHLLRRQAKRNYRAPLVVATPKSLLRSPLAVSRPRELSEGRFLPVLDDLRVTDPSAVRRVVLCWGKVYYDLLAAQEERRQERGNAAPDTAIIRVEEVYPWPIEELHAIAARYASATEVFWTQEEPANMGAFMFVRDRIEELLLPHQGLTYAGRPASASTATGSLRIHRQEQAALVRATFAGI